MDSPRFAEQVVEAVEGARARRTTVKMAGAGHSFTGIATPGDLLLRPDRMTGVLAVDEEGGTVTVAAGTRLRDINAELETRGLSLHNMGDIAEQTIAGAVSTGTHGTGGRVASLSAQVAGFTLVTGRGEVVTADGAQFEELFRMGRVGLGALGILTEVTLRVEPMFGLAAHERPMSWGQALDTYDELSQRHDHVDMYWFPHTDAMMVKTNDRLPAHAQLEPLPSWRSWLDDDFLSNTVFGLITGLGRRQPTLVPRLNGISARALSERRYSDVPHRVFTSPRRVRFKEMEYAVARDVGLDVLREVRRRIDASNWRIGFPVEIRCTPADDMTMSTSYGRESMYLAFHVPARAPHEDYFAGVEEILRAHEGRPHWGKMHTMGAAQLFEVYPGFDDFRALRDELDPDRVFRNPYLDRVLGA